VVLQSDEVLIQLKATNGHVTCNMIIKRQQNIIDVTTINPPKVPNATTPTPTIDYMHELPFTPSSTFWPTILTQVALQRHKLKC
jgi:hypothetical protein